MTREKIMEFINRSMNTDIITLWNECAESKCYYGDSVYVRVLQSRKTFWLRAADAEDGAVDVACQAVIENLMSCFPPERRADANIRRLIHIAENWFANERGAEKQVWLEDIYTDGMAKKVYERLKNDGAVETEEGHYIILTPSFLTKWYEN